MDSYILTTSGISKTYGKYDALKPISINVPYGSIYGIVGKNGAGKTTLMRLITGHSLPTSGELKLFSGDMTLSECRKRTGSMIESPSFYPYLSARKNLEYYRQQLGIPEKGRIDEVLELVGLTDTGDKRYSSFSLGMKQRLGLALSLLNNPDMLILDEPINGMDPVGIVEIRNLLQKLNRDKQMSIIISSHILSELESLATDYAFIDKGILLEEVTAKTLHERCQSFLELCVDNTERTCTILEQQLGCKDYDILPNNIVRIFNKMHESADITGTLIKEGVNIISINSKSLKLEDYFISLVGGSTNA